jgi:hypothetical protein
MNQQVHLHCNMLLSSASFAAPRPRLGIVRPYHLCLPACRERDQLEDAVASLHQQLDSLKDTNSELQQQLQELQADKQELQQRLQQAEQQALGLQQQLDAAVAGSAGSAEAAQQLQQLQQRLQEAEERAQALAQQLQQGQAGSTEQEALLAAANRELAGLREDHDRLLDLLARYDMEKGQLLQERQALLEQMQGSSVGSGGSSAGGQEGTSARRSAGAGGGSEMATLQVGAAWHVGGGSRLGMLVR